MPNWCLYFYCLTGIVFIGQPTSKAGCTSIGWQRLDYIKLVGLFYYSTLNIKIMDMNFETMLQKLAEFIQQEVKTETVIGEPFQLGGFSCVPVIRVGVGFGSGGGKGDSVKTGKGEGGGAGAGLGIDPIGFLVTKEGEISFIS